MKSFLVVLFLLATCSPGGEESFIVESKESAPPDSYKPNPINSSSNDKTNCPKIPVVISNEDGGTITVWIEQPCPDGPEGYPSGPKPDPPF